MNTPRRASTRKFQFVLTPAAEALIKNLQERLGKLRPLVTVTYTDVLIEALTALDKSLEK